MRDMLGQDETFNSVGSQTNFFNSIRSLNFPVRITVLSQITSKTIQSDTKIRRVCVRVQNKK
ncbi:hypothetical protein BpHYR1_008086 [Brachionus plicatilis]|uniref:Uncharacterized protein n=1 Tax=Brachionus plicatilis TaxID=10195 RepID=A0A3M7Q2U4_BRAPC|nr:hypothetical protein BpHYR1_008086 [Brachionus plicatilis]